MNEEMEVFHYHLQKSGLKRTTQRDLILEVFLGNEEHLSIEELYDLVKHKDPSVGFTTVYRTMHLLVEAKLAREVEFNDGRMRYEHEYKHAHHDHLICTECNALIEFFNPEIEQLQEDIANQHGFLIQNHSHRIFGVCKAFHNKEGEKPPYCQKQ